MQQFNLPVAAEVVHENFLSSMRCVLLCKQAERPALVMSNYGLQVLQRLHESPNALQAIRAVWGAKASSQSCTLVAT